MRRSYIAPAWALATGIALAVGADAASGWENSLKPQGKSAPKMTLAENGKAACTVVLPAQPTPQEQRAADDLAKWLKAITGAEFAVSREGSGNSAPARAISVGNTDLLKHADLPESKLDLGNEGYAMAVRDGTLYLLGGRTRGPIYAVYALLEEDLGCRWYDRQAPPTLPHAPTLAFRPVPRHFVPVLEVRDPCYWDAFDANWALANRTAGPSAHIPDELGGGNRPAGGLFVHTYNVLLPPDKYFAAHPEYFSELAGKRKPVQLCLTNPDVLRIVTERVREILRKDRGARYLSVSPNDGRGYCECAACKAIDNAEGTRAGTLLRFVNAVADSIAAEFPDVKITTLAYLDTLPPPKTIQPAKNVVIQLCTDRHQWEWPFCFLTETEKFQNAMKAWEAVGARMHVWDYTVNFSHYSVPMPNLPVVAPNLRFLVAHGASGVMFQGAYQSPGGENSVLRSWVWAKQLWDPSRDTRRLMRDFVDGYYGPARKPMREYNELLWQMWEECHARPHTPATTAAENPLLVHDIRYPPTSALFTEAYVASATRLFARAEELAVDPEILRRVKLAKLPLLYVKLCQGIGFLSDQSEFQPGPVTTVPTPEARRAYAALVDEFEAIAKNERITHLCEGAPDVARKIAKWREMLSREIPKVSSAPLDGLWKFKSDPDDAGVRERWFAPDVKDAGWADMRTDREKGWESQGFPGYLGCGWYRQRFTVPKGFADRRHLGLLFRAVDEDAEVWVNGRKATEHTCASTGLSPDAIWIQPFSFDVRPFLKDGENLVAVRVWNRLGMGGVWKPAYLVSTDEELDAEKLALAARLAGTGK